MDMNKKVAIWGPNWWCNIGDDLQSVVLAMHAKKRGLTPIVYKLDPSIGEEYGIEIADTLDELFEDAGFCLIAGGALLTPTMLPKQFLVAQQRAYAKSFRDLHRAAIRHDKKVCAVSMGGDGKTRNRWFWYDLPRNRFFASKYFIDGSVRLEGDITQMKAFGKKFVHYPDCLFSIQKFIELPTGKIPSEGAPLQVGFNLQKRHIPDSFLEDLHDYAEKNTDIHFNFATTHMESAIKKYDMDYEYLPTADTETVKYVPYESPQQQMKFVADMDVFITSKLHLGFLGLMMGTPFISYMGMGKARTFIKSLGAHHAILDDSVPFDSLIVEGGLLRLRKQELIKKYDEEVLAKMVEDSWGHYEFCDQLFDRYC